VCKKEIKVNYIKEKCPLCGIDSKYYEVDHGDKKYFKCDTCSKFQVSINAEEMLQAAPTSWKENTSKTSSPLSDDQLLLIFVENQNEENILTAKVEMKENVSL
jgi:ssDNA-binding Zn-finger/Zn-ribbon topoisomerase 1